MDLCGKPDSVKLGFLKMFSIYISSKENSLSLELKHSVGDVKNLAK